MRRLEDTVRRIHVVDLEREAPPRRADTLVVVLDPGWTPMPEGRDDLVSSRQLFGATVERRDLFDEALDLVDAWADRAHAADRLQVDGITYWFRMRETMWRWMHERLLWADVLVTLGVPGRDLRFRVPRGEAALRDVAEQLGTIDDEGDQTGQAGGPDPGPPPSAGNAPAGRPTIAVRAMRGLGRLMGRIGTASASEPRVRRMIDRAERLGTTPGPRVVVLTTPATHQRIEAGGNRRDPILGPVIDGLERVGLEPVLVAMGTDPRRDADWSILAADDRMLPQWLLGRRWGRPEDRDRADRAAAVLQAAALSLKDTAVVVDGLDLTGPFIEALRGHLVHTIHGDVMQRSRVDRMLAEVRPRAIVLAQEGIRLPWLIAGRDAGVPVFAVQHGILYPGHAGYPHRRDPAVVRATRTFVYGRYEREMLLERGAYLPEEVEVGGSPRLDLDRPGTGLGPMAADAERRAERDAVRAELGVRAGDRLLVVSTVHVGVLQRAHLAPMIERLLGGPLPNVHLVFKLHPGERDEGPYRALLEGLARADGHAAPPISVVRDVDLYRLLRSADAHLGLHSTVLTDAVAAGTLNLVATSDAHADLLGYVAAGVARPVRTIADVRYALERPAPPDPEARAAFLDRHFAPGNAGERIARSIAGALDARATPDGIGHTARPGPAGG